MVNNSVVLLCYYGRCVATIIDTWRIFRLNGAPWIAEEAARGGGRSFAKELLLGMKLTAPALTRFRMFALRKAPPYHLATFCLIPIRTMKEKIIALHPKLWRRKVLSERSNVDMRHI